MNSTAPGMHLPEGQVNPAAAVGIPNAQPNAAPGESTAATAASQLGQDTTVAGSAMRMHSNSSAAVSRDVGSAGQQTTSPEDLTGINASPAHSSQLVPAGELAMQQGEETDKTAADVQPVQTPPHVQSLLHIAESEPVRGLADPNKRLLAKMGSNAPSDVSKQLLQEVAARSQVEGLLQVCCLHIVLGLLANGLLPNTQWRISWLPCQQHSRHTVEALHHGPPDLCSNSFTCFAV